MKVKTTAVQHSHSARNFVVRLMDAERIATELSGGWEQVQLAYHELVVSRLHFVNSPSRAYT
jgi:hypothetical protein